MESLPNWSLTVLMVMQVVLISFWIVMVISVPMAPMRLFEDHKHKHLWLYTVLFVPVIGAIWYFAWRMQNHSGYEEIQKAKIQGIADAYREENE